MQGHNEEHFRSGLGFLSGLLSRWRAWWSTNNHCCSRSSSFASSRGKCISVTATAHATRRVAVASVGTASIASSFACSTPPVRRRDPPEHRPQPCSDSICHNQGEWFEKQVRIQPKRLRRECQQICSNRKPNAHKVFTGKVEAN